MAETQPEHIVRSYTQELDRLRERITEMGGLVEAQLASAATAIVMQDSSAATQVMEQDRAVDALERDVEAKVIQMLALRQPMAQDLRSIVSALKITAALERIGDYATNVAKRSHRAVAADAAVQPLRHRQHDQAGAGKPENSLSMHSARATKRKRCRSGVRIRRWTTSIMRFSAS